MHFPNCDEQVSKQPHAIASFGIVGCFLYESPIYYVSLDFLCHNCLRMTAWALAHTLYRTKKACKIILFGGCSLSDILLCVGG
jgi:hypothetical protein